MPQEVPIDPNSQVAATFVGQNLRGDEAAMAAQRAAVEISGEFNDVAGVLDGFSRSVVLGPDGPAGYVDHQSVLFASMAGPQQSVEGAMNTVRDEFRRACRQTNGRQFKVNSEIVTGDNGNIAEVAVCSRKLRSRKPR